MSENTESGRVSIPLQRELEAWQPMHTAPKDRQILIKWGDAILEATWLKHRNAFCYHSNDYHLHSESAFSELEYDWLDGWQDATQAKIEALDAERTSI